jgi:pimeloyl-ACP methyl ester carboxylesterase
VDGVAAFHYRDSGAAAAASPAGSGPLPPPPLLLLHGTASSLHTWDGWVAELAPSRRVIRVDMPGFGLTGPGADPAFDYSPEALADAVASFVRFLALDGAANGGGGAALGPVVDVAGNSLGGQVAHELAVRHPALVRRLVLVDAAGPYPRGTGLPLVFRLGTTWGLRHVLRLVTPLSAVRHSLEDCAFDKRHATPALVARHHALTLRAGNRGALLKRLAGIGAEAAKATEKRAGLRGLMARTLIMWGRNDTWLPVSFVAQFEADIPGATSLVFDDTGHLPMEERPAETAAAARAFLDAP